MIGRQRGKQTARKTDSLKDSYGCRQTDRQIDHSPVIGVAGRQTDRQKDRQSNRQAWGAGRQADRSTTHLSLVEVSVARRISEGSTFLGPVHGVVVVMGAFVVVVFFVFGLHT